MNSSTKSNVFLAAVIIGASVTALIACSQSYASEVSIAVNQLDANASCCGPITPAGKKLLEVLDAANVENRWLPHQYVNWETGEPQENTLVFSSHCSAFTAAIGKRLNVYMLRPPEHSPVLLASAQTAWFAQDAGKQAGWSQLFTEEEAQHLSNNGQLVVASYENPHPKKPGHIAIVRPSLKNLTALNEDGPEITQAGATNYADTNVRTGFAKHAGAYRRNVRYFVHAVY